MEWIIIALAAYFGLAIAAIFDKYIVSGPIKSPAAYAAAVGIFSILLFLLLPFFFFLPSFGQFVLDLVAGAVFIFALAVYFAALKYGEASRVVPVTSAFVPLFTLALATGFGLESINAYQSLGFMLLVGGGVLISAQKKHKLFKKIKISNFLLTIAASALFAISFVLMKQIFNTQPFMGGLIWSNAGRLAAAMLLLTAVYLFSQKKSQPFHSLKKPKNIGLLAAGQTIGGLSVIGQYYAISLASVSLVTALQGFQYAFLFIILIFIGKYVKKLKEDFSPRILYRKVSAIVLLSFGLIFLVLPARAGNGSVEYGATFSHTFAKYGLQLDWQEAYEAIVTDLGLKWLRLPIYWSEVEPLDNTWDFSATNYQLHLAEQNNIQVILAIGRKLPRWPECHIPDWAGSLDYQKQNEEILVYIANVVKMYDNHPAVVAWQVENEPLFPFGECPKPDKKFLQREIDLVKSISSKPIVITDSGEFSLWWRESRLADILGSTMYRQVYHDKYGIIFYYFPATFYKIKSIFARAVTGKNIQFINVELQGEPWGERPLDELSVMRQMRFMSAEQLKANARFAERIGFSPALFWGAEWWYWLKTHVGDSTLWETAKSIIRQN